MTHAPTPRRVFRGPRGSIAVEIRRYGRPGRFQIIADEGDHVAVGAEITLEGLVRAGWQELTEAEPDRDTREVSGA